MHRFVETASPTPQPADPEKTGNGRRHDVGITSRHGTMYSDSTRLFMSQPSDSVDIYANK